MRGSRALLGSRLFSAFVRPTFYRQFVGGDSDTELKDTADRLSQSGLRLMVCWFTFVSYYGGNLAILHFPSPHRCAPCRRRTSARPGRT